MGNEQGLSQGSQSSHEEISLSQLIELLTYEDQEDLADVIRGIIISKSLDKKNLDQSDVEIIHQVVNRVKYRISHDGFVPLVLSMKDFIRENTHGAVSLDRVYVSKRLYKEIAKDSGASPESSMTVYGVKVMVSDNIVSGKWVTGIGKAKYKGVPATDLLLRGQI